MVQEHPGEPAGENKCREPNLRRKTRDHNREERGFGDRRTLPKEIRRGRRQEVLPKDRRRGSASCSASAPFALTPRATLGAEPKNSAASRLSGHLTQSSLAGDQGAFQFGTRIDSYSCQVLGYPR